MPPPVPAPARLLADVPALPSTTHHDQGEFTGSGAAGSMRALMVHRSPVSAIATEGHPTAIPGHNGHMQGVTCRRTVHTVTRNIGHGLRNSGQLLST